MTGTGVETRTQITIDGHAFGVHPSEDLVNLMTRIETAASSGPAFVNLTDDTSTASVLVGPHSRVVIITSPQRSNDDGRNGSDQDYDPLTVTYGGDWEL